MQSMVWPPGNGGNCSLGLLEVCSFIPLRQAATSALHASRQHSTNEWQLYQRKDQQSFSRPIPIKSYQIVSTSWVSQPSSWDFKSIHGSTIYHSRKQGVSVLSYCLAHRIPPLNSWRQWANLTWGRLCVILVLFDSFVAQNAST
jgi:hypothetical protein